MKKLVTLAALGVALLYTPAMARDRSGVEFGRGVDTHHSHRHRHNRSGAWVGNGHGDWRGHGGGHRYDHFSPRGQGGHHWGW